MEFSICRVNQKDVYEMVKVNTKAWETTYRGFLPNELIDSRKISTLTMTLKTC